MEPRTWSNVLGKGSLSEGYTLSLFATLSSEWLNQLLRLDLNSLCRLGRP